MAGLTTPFQAWIEDLYKGNSRFGSLLPENVAKIGKQPLHDCSFASNGLTMSNNRTCSEHCIASNSPGDGNTEDFVFQFC